MSSEAAGPMDVDEEVLKLQEKLCQCRLERERLLQEKKRWRIKEILVQRGIEKVEEKLRVEIESNSGATSEYEQKRKTLEEALETKKKSVLKLRTATKEFFDDTDMPYMEMEAELEKEREEYGRMVDEYEYITDRLIAHRRIVRKLESQLHEERNNLLAFLETCEENLKITDDVKPLLQAHYDAFINTLKSDDDDWDWFIEELYDALQLDSDHNRHEMFPRVDFISPVSAAMSKILNLFRRKKTESSGAFIYY
nr:PREDICTED: uncharacterized protein LOC101291178 isoform X2 [Fragaria vesca subsp. vesca]